MENEIVIYTTTEEALQHACGMGDKEVAEALSAQYRAIQSAAREMVRFGGMVATVEAALEGPQRGPTHGGQGLKGWLAEHCPDISYRTARRYRDLYRGAERQIAKTSGVDMPAGLLLDALEGERKVERPRGLESIEADVDDLLQGKSARQLMFSFASDPETRPRAPATPPEPMTPERIERMREQMLSDIVVELAGFFRHNYHMSIVRPEVRAAFRRELKRYADLLG